MRALSFPELVASASSEAMANALATYVSLPAGDPRRDLAATRFYAAAKAKAAAVVQAKAILSAVGGLWS